MAETLVATFTTQVAAASVVDRLLARGVHRDHIAMRTDESIDGVPASATAPTSVVSALSHRPAKPGLPREVPPQPEGVGYATVSVVLAPELHLPEAAIRRVLEHAGAAAVTHAAPAQAPRERDDYQPEPGLGPLEDVERARDAVRRTDT